MKSWVVTPDDIVCPVCKSSWSRIDNETFRYKRCPNCGEELVNGQKHKPMVLKLETSSAHCSPTKFSINGIKATSYDFGQGVDEEPNLNGEFGCGCHVFRHFERPKHGILGKYHITMEDYRTVCAKLDTQLSRGRCKYCG